MTNDPELSGLDPALAELVAADRAGASGPDEAQRARLRARLAAGLVLPAVGAAAWAPAAAAAPKVVAGAALGGMGKPAAILLAVAIGTGAVVGIRQVTRPPAVERERVATPAAPPTAASAPVSPPVWVAAERALVEAARGALGRRQGQQALQQLDEHARRFPAGLLAEEREALRVSVLVSLGRLEAARAAAVRFEAAYPASVHRDAIRRVLRSSD